MADKTVPQVSANNLLTSLHCLCIRCLTPPQLHIIAPPVKKLQRQLALKNFGPCLIATVCTRPRV